MGNTSFTPLRNEEDTNSRSFSNVTRTINALRRMMWRRTVHGGSRAGRSQDFEAFERLLREDFLANTTSATDTPEHLVTTHVSYTENQRECNIYVSAFNNSGEKVAEAIIYQDLMPDSETECFLSVMPPQADRISNITFKIPCSAKYIKGLLLKISRPPEENA